MSKGEFLCVQEVAFEVADARAQLWILDRVVASSTVSLIADNRMFEPREMNTDLMCSTGLEFYIEQGEAIKALPHPIKRQRIATATHDRHARPIRRIARQRL